MMQGRQMCVTVPTPVSKNDAVFLGPRSLRTKSKSSDILMKPLHFRPGLWLDRIFIIGDKQALKLFSRSCPLIFIIIFFSVPGGKTHAFKKYDRFIIN